MRLLANKHRAEIVPTDDDNLGLNLESAFIEFDQKCDVLSVAVADGQDLFDVIDNVGGLIQAMESHGISDGLLAFANVNGDMESLLNVEELPSVTDENREELLEASLEGLKESGKAAWNKIIEILKTIWNKLKEWGAALVKLVMGLRKQCESEIKRLDGIKTPNKFQDEEIELTKLQGAKEDLPAMVAMASQTLKDIPGALKTVAAVAGSGEEDKLKESTDRLETWVLTFDESSKTVTLKDAGVDSVGGASKLIQSCLGLIKSISDFEKGVKEIDKAASKAIKEAEKAAKTEIKEGDSEDKKAEVKAAKAGARVAQKAISAASKSMMKNSKAVRQIVKKCLQATSKIKAGKGE